MNINAMQSIGEIVADDYRKSEVLKKYGIDFCCGGRKTLGQVCRERKIDEERLIAELEAASGPTGGQRLPYAQWDPAFLADYIVNVHHRFLYESMPGFLANGDKVAARHGQAHPETVEIARLLHVLKAELDEHLRKEEVILFPYVRILAAARKEGTGATPPPFGTVDNPIRMMEDEHDSAGQIMKDIRRLSNGFQPPEDACTTYRLWYKGLEDLEADLFLHIHLENNVLFPQARVLEEELLAARQK